MPIKHRYKCLNPNCKPAKSRPITFVMMNSPQPMCPDCGSIKLEDWGEAGNLMFGSPGTKNIDAGMDALASQFGMTNMSNKDGKAVKGSTDARGEMGHIRLPGGVTAPVDFEPKCSNINLTSTPLKLQAGAAFAGKPSPRRSIPTNITAEYKGQP